MSAATGEQDRSDGDNTFIVPQTGKIIQRLAKSREYCSGIRISDRQRLHWGESRSAVHQGMPIDPGCDVAGYFVKLLDGGFAGPLN